MQKLLKAQCFINEMHEYEIKSFSKALEFNPDPIKIGKTKHVLGKTVMGKIQEVGKIKTHKPNLKKKLS